MKGRSRRRAIWIAAATVAVVVGVALPAGAANSSSLRVAFIRGDDLWVLDLRTYRAGALERRRPTRLVRQPHRRRPGTPDDRAYVGSNGRGRRGCHARW